jgi:hypothetical protein
MTDGNYAIQKRLLVAIKKIFLFYFILVPEFEALCPREEAYSARLLSLLNTDKSPETID